MVDLDENFWTRRYEDGYTGWDIGSVSRPIDQYLCQIENKNLEVLVPGGGNAYEVAKAWDLGFSKVHLLDISEFPIKNFLERNPGFPQEQIHHEDFFEHQGNYDLILEQTFFCALDPKLRNSYAQKIHQLLKPGGRLVGVLFDREFMAQGPPFGGSAEEYQNYFKPFFKFQAFEKCYNSIPPRQGSELWINLQKL
ncbi:MAG: TPMT family class I SAM-dependent methyltransferase [Cyclobacteriaceae bacterium]|nr:TPMT family class I SAM-dependent methyltransferase [Cyclobacteriaceae bacterium]MDX5466760.1 TPMT family class I SAM-dependent methyltransferase [Cyclobacteriaceae bacterium]